MSDPTAAPKPIDVLVDELLRREIDHLHEEKLQSILVVFRLRSDGVTEVGAITSSPAQGEFPMATNMADVRKLLDMAYNALMGVAVARSVGKTIGDPS